LVDGAWVAQSESSADPAEAIQPCVEQVLRQAGLTLSQIAAFAVNVGPGSVLGIRATILSARAWGEIKSKPVLTWSSHLAAAWLARGTCDAVVSEGRAGNLNVQKVNAQGPVGELHDSEAKDLSHLQIRPISGGFRHASELSLGDAVDVWSSLPKIFVEHNILVTSDHPDALNSATVYALWSGQRHSSAQ
jgi:hypothetical protein